MKNIIKQFTMAMLAVISFSCDFGINSSGGNSIRDNIFYNAAKNAMPVFKQSTPSGSIAMPKASGVSKTAWDFGEPIYEMYNTFKEYDPATDTGSTRTGIDNIYKLLYQNGSFYNECMNFGFSTGDIKLSSPYDFGRTDNTYNKIYDQESVGSANYFAGKKDGSVNYCLLCWYREYTVDHKERGILQGHFDELTGDLNLDLVCFVEYATSVYSHRVHIEGNSNTHRFTKLLTAKWNGGSASFRAWFSGSGIARGTGNTFLFKIKDNNGLTTEKYFDFPADADVTILQAMSNAGSDTTSSPYKSEVDAMVSNGENFNILNASPVPSEIPGSAAHFHGISMGNMKPVAETTSEVEGKWYGKAYNLNINGMYFQLTSTKNADWFTGNLTNLNTDSDPKQMDLNINDSYCDNSTGMFVLGIYKIENGILIYKVGNPNDTTRPIEFNMLNGTLMAFSRDPNNLPEVPGGFKEFTFLPLEFPFKNPDDIVHLAAFGIPNWSGPEHPHGDIDLQIDSAHSGSVIISPTYGTVKSITYHTLGNFSNPPDLIVVKVEIYINSEYTVWISFEPCDSIGFLSNQMAEIKVSVGQEVMPGDTIGNLLVGAQGYAIMPITLIKDGNVNLCPYSNSSTNAQLIYDYIIANRGANLCDGKICCVESF